MRKKLLAAALVVASLGLLSAPATAGQVSRAELQPGDLVFFYSP